MINGEFPPEPLDEIRVRVDLICARNLESGRAAKVMRRWTPGIDNSLISSTPSPELVERYRNHVLSIYGREYEFVEALYQRDNDVWQVLWERLHRIGQRILSRRDRADRETVSDFVQQTCETVYLSQFPYDVAFDAWVSTILNNHILQRYSRSREFLDRHPFVCSIDEGVHDLDQHGTHRLDEMIQELGPNAFEQLDARMLIFDAIHQLSSQGRQEVILYTYFLGWSDDEIAHHMDRSKSAIYTLRHRALRQLREVIKT